MKAISASLIRQAFDVGRVIALLGFCSTAAAQSNANMKQVKLSNSDLPGYSLSYEGERDWALFTAETGAPAECLQSKPIANGTEQMWRKNGSDGDPLRGRVRVDYALFDSPGEAAAAARTAALLINNATAKLQGNQTVGDASWKTVAGSPALIVQRGPAVIYLSAQGDAAVSEDYLASIGSKVIQRIDKVQLKITPEKLACDIETFLGLNLIQSQTERLKSLARELTLGGSTARRAASDLKSIISAESGKGMSREAAANLLRAVNSLADG